MLVFGAADATPQSMSVPTPPSIGTTTKRRLRNTLCSFREDFSGDVAQARTSHEPTKIATPSSDCASKILAQPLFTVPISNSCALMNHGSRNHGIARSEWHGVLDGRTVVETHGSASTV